MQFPSKYHHVALAIAAFMGMSSVAQADDTIYTRQERAGLMLNIPFDSHGFVFKDSVVSFVFQSARVKSSAYGWQLAFGSKLTSFSPVFAASALGGDRCGYVTAGVSYGAGQWGVPVSLTGPYVQVGLSNVGGFGGFQAGLSSLGCFKRYTPPAPAPAPSSGGSLSPATVEFRATQAWLRNTPGAAEFDWA